MRGNMSLMLDIKGNWSLKFGMDGAPVGNSLNKLLEHYACINGPEFADIAHRIVERNISQKAAPDEKVESALKKYVKNNKEKVLQSFTKGLEKTALWTQSIRNVQMPPTEIKKPVIPDHQI